MGMRLLCKYCKVEMLPHGEVRLPQDQDKESTYGMNWICPRCTNNVIRPKPKIWGVP